MCIYDLAISYNFLCCTSVKYNYINVYFTAHFVSAIALCTLQTCPCDGVHLPLLQSADWLHIRPCYTVLSTHLTMYLLITHLLLLQVTYCLERLWCVHAFQLLWLNPRFLILLQMFYHSLCCTFRNIVIWK